MPRFGKKRSDRRWVDPDGTVWASKFEYQVYAKLKSLGYMVRKCEQGGDDTFVYYTDVKGGECSGCGCTEVVQRRTYTPDLHLTTDPDVDGPDDGPRGKYIETKGFFPASKRSLLRAFRKTGPNIDLLFLAERDNWVTKGKSKMSDYFKRYIKDVPFAVWDKKDLPEGWIR